MKQNIFSKLSSITKKQKSIILAIILILCITNSMNCLLKFTPIGLFDKKGESYINSTLVRAGASFVLTRTLNGAVSMFQDSTIDATPAGVGISFAAGEVLDPINDFIEKVSYILFLSTISLSIQKVILQISAGLSINFLLSISIICFIIGIWRKEQFNYDINSIGKNVLILAIFFRLLVPTIGLVNDTIYKIYFESEFEDSMSEIEAVQEKVSKIESSNENDKKNESFWTKLKKLKDIVAISAIKDKLEDIKSSISNAFNRLIAIATIFIVQTVIVPILTLWVMSKLLKAMIGKTMSSAITNKVKHVARRASMKNEDGNESNQSA